MKTSLRSTNQRVLLLVILVSGVMHYADAEGNCYGDDCNFSNCAAKTGCYIYDQIDCLIGNLQPGESFTCIECTGNTGNCDNTPNGAQLNKMSNKYAVLDQDTDCTTIANCHGCPAGQTSPTASAEVCYSNTITRQADGTDTASIPLFSAETLFSLVDGNLDASDVAVASVVAVAAAPAVPGLFGGLGFLGQPGITLGGGGILPAAALTNALVLAEVGVLVHGLAGAVVLSIFSSELDVSGFSLPRTIPATAVVFSEPNVEVPRTTISRRSSNSPSTPDSSCNRPIIPLGRKINVVKSAASSAFNHVLGKKMSPVLDRAYNRWALVYQKGSRAKATFYERLGLSCLVPKLVRPWMPIFEYLQCKLGLHTDDFMEAPKCNSARCVDPVIEDREITNDLGLPNLDNEMLEVSTIDDCFGDMRKIEYGARILVKIVDDASCDDPQYKDTCESLMEENRIVSEEECELPGCKGTDDDQFVPCFGCSDATERNGHPDYAYNYHDRQSGESFQVTRQSRRVICRRGIAGRRVCRLRVSRSIQLRMRTYGRALQFIQSEQYLSMDDIELVKYFQKLFTYYTTL